MIEEELHQHIVNNVPLVNGRVYANVLEQGTKKPAIVTVVDDEIDSIGGMDTCAEAEVDISWSIYTIADGDGYMENKHVKNEVKAALRSFPPVWGEIHVSDDFEDKDGGFVQHIRFKTKE